MRLPSYLTYRPSGFAFRLIVPADCRSVVGRTVIKKSLRTHDRARAQAWAQVLAMQYAQAFQAMRAGTMPKDRAPSVDEILANMQQGSGGKKYEVEMHADGGFRVKADGPEDHDRAMELANWMAKSGLAPDGSRAKPMAKPKALSLADAVALYMSTEASTLKPDTLDARQRAFKSFLTKFGAKTPIDEISRPKAGEWAADLMRNGASKRTAVNYVSHVAQLFALLVTQGHLEANPVKGVLVMKRKEKKALKDAGNEWEAFDTTQIKSIYDPLAFAKMTMMHTRWAAVLGLYTGARVGELAQIFLRDIIESDGVPCLRICTDSDGQGLKTQSSKRLVPLHPDVLNLGLLDLVQKLRNQGEVNRPGFRRRSRATF